MQNHELFDGKDTYSLNDLRTIRCAVEKEMLEEILDVLTDKTLDRRDRHFHEYAREIHDERLREIISNQSIILTTVIPEPFRGLGSFNHTSQKTPIYRLLYARCDI